MNTNQIKLILMNYSEDEYVPELKGIYINNIITPLKSDVFDFIRKYNLNIPIFEYFPNDRDAIRAMRKLAFYMNLLNFNDYSSWQVMGLPSPQIKSLNQIIYNFVVTPQKFQRYIIYRNV
jgi:hypothetical protein